MLHEKKLTELAGMLNKEQITSVEICKSYLERIKNLNGKINAYITVDENIVLADAAEADKRRASKKTKSIYDGIPIAVKDNICTKGIKTTCASKILENFVAPYDAEVFSKLKDSGFILLGKTNLDEFAMGSSTESSFFGPTKNPYDLERVPGGSSGGSAAAVSAMTAPASLGSDTGGSIRQPASFCGVVGIKPTYGRVSRYGLVAYASSLDQIGTFANSVTDAAALLSIISGKDNKDSTSVDKEIDFSPDKLTFDPKGLKIGIPEEYYNGIDPEIKERTLDKINALVKLGAQTVNISLKYTEYAIPIYYLIATAEASSNLARYDGVRYGYRSPNIKNLSELYIKSRSEGFGKEVKRRIHLGTFSLSSGYYDAYYLKALKGRTLIIEDFKNAFTKADVIITPVTTTTAFKIGEMINDPLQMYMSDILTISVNLAGIPALSVPVGLHSNGMPIGLQIMGNHFDEKTILNIAGAVEKTGATIKPTI